MKLVKVEKKEAKRTTVYTLLQQFMDGQDTLVEVIDDEKEYKNIQVMTASIRAYIKREGIEGVKVSTSGGHLYLEKTS